MKNYLLLRLKSALLSIFVLLISIFLQAQDVIELKNYLDQVKVSADPSVVADANHLQSLISDLNASLYITKGITTTYGDAPFLTVDVDVQSINMLYEANPIFSQAELLTIRINNPDDLNIVIDLGNLNGFSSLKYVYFLCSVNCTSVQINKLFKSTNAEIRSFYLISIPS